MIINKNKEKTLFLDLLKSNKTGIVKFYMDNCPACMAMTNEWKVFKKNMLKINPALPILSMERSVLEKVNFPAAKYINGFPTILEILPGGKKGLEFNKPRTVDNLIYFAKHIGKNNKSKKRRNLKGDKPYTGGNMPPPTPPPPTPPPPPPPPSPESTPPQSPKSSPRQGDNGLGEGLGYGKEMKSRRSSNSKPTTKRLNDAFEGMGNYFTQSFKNITNKIGFSGGKKSKKYKRTKKRDKKHKRRTKRKTKRR